MLAHPYLNALEYTSAARREDPRLAERARIALRAAGDRTLSLASYAAAARFYAAALLACPEDDPDRVLVLASAGRAMQAADRTGVDLLKAALEQLRARGDADRAAQIAVDLCGSSPTRSRAPATSSSLASDTSPRSRPARRSARLSSGSSPSSSTRLGLPRLRLPARISLASTRASLSADLRSNTLELPRPGTTGRACKARCVEQAVEPAKGAFSPITACLPVRA
jgi:hypothetical protein